MFLGTNSSILLLTIALTALFSGKLNMNSCKYRFSAVPDFFIDYVKAAKECPNSKLTRQSTLGLLERAYDTDTKPTDDRSLWTRFASYVETLNRQSQPWESYKVLHLVRHGLSVHNVVMEKVGSAAWKVGALFFLGLIACPGQQG
jgi:hypothetical protein